MASTTSNTDLVPKEALDELKALDAQAAKVTKTLEGLLTPRYLSWLTNCRKPRVASRL